MTLDDYSIIKNYNFENFYLESYGITQPSSEALTHAAIYEIFSNVHAIIHIHNDNIWKYMLDNSFFYTKDVEYGTREMIKEIYRIYNKFTIDDGSIFAMKGHPGGIVSFGRDLNSSYNSILEISKMLNMNF